METRHQPIDLVVVNLYPVRANRGQTGLHLDDAIENIDIGGPTMLRAAAKNHRRDRGRRRRDYAEILEEMQRTSGRQPDAPASTWPVRPLSIPRRYDGAIANHLGALDDG